MKKLFISFLLIGSFISCKKKNEAPPNNNEMKATVVVSPTKTILINATGSKVVMGMCASLGGGTYIEGTNEDNAAIYITVYETGIRCVTAPGTYESDFSCQYRPNVSDQATPIYAKSSGNITFTTINDSKMEGSFTAVCKCISPGCVFGVDSVIVIGTFKGDPLN
jgi:hypothetical protein